jgi:integrase/recombinase XerD
MIADDKSPSNPRNRYAPVPLKQLTDQANADLEWLSAVLAAQGLRATTRQTYRVWSKHLVWWLQGRNKLLRHLDHNLILKFMARFEERSASCRIQVRAALRCFLKALVLGNKLPREAVEWANPVTREKRSQGQPQSLSDEQITALLDVLKKHKLDGLQGMREYAFFSMLFRLGIRVSELLHLNRNKNCVTGQGSKVLELRFEQKGGRTVVYHLVDEKGQLTETGKILDEWLCFRQRIEKYEDQRRLFMRSKEWVNSDFVFPSQKGEAMTYRVVQRRLPDLAKEAGIMRHVSPHILRHSFAMFMKRRGTPIDVLQQLMNHAHITSTMQYVEVHEDEKRKARDLMEKFKTE